MRTPAEAIRFLLCNFPSLRGVMRDGHYKVAASDLELDLADHPEQLHYPLGTDEVVRVIPVITGAGGVGKILAGAALIGVSLLVPGAGVAGTSFLASATGAATFGAGLAAAAGSIGAALVLGGVADLITPVPRAPDVDNDPRENFNFSGIQNVTREGVPVPIVYGEMIVGSVVVSAGLNVDDEG